MFALSLQTIPVGLFLDKLMTVDIFDGNERHLIRRGERRQALTVGGIRVRDETTTGGIIESAATIFNSGPDVCFFDSDASAYRWFFNRAAGELATLHHLYRESTEKIPHTQIEGRIFSRFGEGPYDSVAVYRIYEWLSGLGSEQVNWVDSLGMFRWEGNPIPVCCFGSNAGKAMTDLSDAWLAFMADNDRMPADVQEICRRALGGIYPIMENYDGRKKTTRPRHAQADRRTG